MIYLYTSDGHKDSLSLDNYATNEEELKQLLILNQGVWNQRKIRDIFIDYIKEEIHFEYLEDWDDVWEKDVNYFRTINKINI